MRLACLRRHATLFRPVRLTTLAMTMVGALGLSACTTPPFQPAPALYTLWKQPGVDEQGIRTAMLSCGFPDSAYVSAIQLTPNDWAGAELCMVGRGFQYQDGRILCETSPGLPACAKALSDKTLGVARDVDAAIPGSHVPLRPAYADWTRPGADADAVRREMTACGYTELERPSNTMKLNDVAAGQLCMLGKGFKYGWPYQALLCKSMPSLAACRGQSIDTAHCCAPPKAVGQR